MEEINIDLYNKIKRDMDSQEDISEFINSKGYKYHDTMECFLHKHGKINQSVNSTPSLSINLKKGKWHCFSCGRGGGYVDMLYWHAVDVEGRRLSSNDDAKKNKFSVDRMLFLDEYLRKNPNVAKKYGVDTLKTKLSFSLESLQYLFDSKTMIDKSRRELLLASDEESNEKNENYITLKKFRKVHEKQDILKFLSEIQYRETAK